MRRRDLFWAENLARTTSGSKHQTVRFFPFRRKHAIAHGIDKVVVDALSLPRYSLMLEPQSLWHHTTPRVLVCARYLNTVYAKLIKCKIDKCATRSCHDPFSLEGFAH